MMRFYCLSCGAEYDARPVGTCGKCLQLGFLVPLPVKDRGRLVETAPRRRSGLVAAGTLRGDHTPAPYADPWNQWGIGMPHTGIVYGPPGAGKSTVIARLAIGAARRVPAVIVSAEEGTAAPFKQRLSRCGLDEMTGHRLTVSDARTLAELSEDVGAAEPHALVFVDSLTEMGCTPDALAECLHGRSWWATQHLTTGGTPRGGLTASHLVDVVVRVVNGQATPTKNRWGSSKCIDVFPEEQAA